MKGYQSEVRELISVIKEVNFSYLKWSPSRYTRFWMPVSLLNRTALCPPSTAHKAPVKTGAKRRTHTTTCVHGGPEARNHSQ